MPRPSQDNSEPIAARRLAAELFILGFPLLLMDFVRRAHPLEFNHILQLPDDGEPLAPGLADEGARTVRTSAWIDLSGGPAVMHLPHTRGRYFSLTLVDTAGEPFASLGSRTGDDSGSDLALAGPRWRGEFAGHPKAVRSPSDLVWAVSRFTANSAADRVDTEALAARQGLVALRKTDEPRDPVPLRLLEAPTYGVIQQLANMAPDMFGHRLGVLLERAPQDAGPRIRQPLKALNDLLASDPLKPELVAALTRGFADGLATIRAAAERASGPEANGWRASGAAIDPGGGGGLARATRAFVNLGGPVQEDVLSLVCDTDEAGRELSGTERYRIHFARGASPPVEAFWSLFVTGRSSRPGSTRMRRGISDRNDLAQHPDGSLDVIIQHAVPGGGAARNWLPAPDGPMTLNMRLHWPRPAALSGAWRMPGVERLGSGFSRRSASRGVSTSSSHAPPGDDLRPP